MDKDEFFRLVAVCIFSEDRKVVAKEQVKQKENEYVETLWVCVDTNMREQDSDSVFSNMIGILTELKDFGFDMIKSVSAPIAQTLSPNPTLSTPTYSGYFSNTFTEEQISVDKSSEEHQQQAETAAKGEILILSTGRDVLLGFQNIRD